MTDFVDEDDAVISAAREVLDGDASEGTKNVRRGTTDDGVEFVYRIDPDSDAGDGGTIKPDDVRSSGEFPDADVTLWRANRETVEREAERRGLGDAGRSVAGTEGGNRDGGNRER